MTHTQKALVQATWASVEPMSDTAARLFYDRLFFLSPDLRTLFPDDLAEQRRKLMQTIGVAVKGLFQLEQIVPAVQALGQRHVGYGVSDADYDTVGAALLWTLEQGLGDAFTSEVRAAWAGAYSLVADTMRNAAHGPAVV